MSICSKTQASYLQQRAIKAQIKKYNCNTIIKLPDDKINDIPIHMSAF